MNKAMFLLGATLTFDKVIDLIMAAGILLAAAGLFINLRSNYLTVMHKCMADYRRIIRELQCEKNINKQLLKRDLLGLFNEQLFYMRWWYLPRGIRKEWKNTMLCHLKNDDNYSVVEFEEKDWQKFSRVRDFMKKNSNQFVS